MLERGQFPKSQFTDIVGQGAPPQPEAPEQVIRPILPDDAPAARSAAEMFQQQQAQSAVERVVQPPPAGETSQSSGSVVPEPEQPEGSSYGPVRRRYFSKQTQDSVFRPPAMKHEDFAEMMQELVPQIVIPDSSSSTVDQVMQTTSPRGTSQKREASSEGEAPSSSKPRVEAAVSEGLFAEEVLLACPGEVPSVEVLMSAFLQKRLQKELPPSGNPVELQAKINDAKSAEWATLLEKPAVRVWTGNKAKTIREKHPDRFIGSRFAITEKTEDQSTRIKARWCLQGHLDPDFRKKIDRRPMSQPNFVSACTSVNSAGVGVQEVDNVAWRYQGSIP